MCGIVGLFAKSPVIEDRLGEHLAAMLRQMGDRGPDSAGVAVYRDPVEHGHSKLVLCTPHASEDWEAVAELLGATSTPAVRHNHALLTLEVVRLLRLQQLLGVAQVRQIWEKVPSNDALQSSGILVLIKSIELLAPHIGVCFAVWPSS